MTSSHRSRTTMHTLITAAPTPSNRIGRIVCAMQLLFWVALLLLPSASRAQAAAGNDTILLNGTWQFSLAPNDAAADQMNNFYQSSFDRSKFVTIPVPSNWAMQGFEPPHYKPFKDQASQGFYVHRFNVPATWKDKRVLLHFGGVWDSAEVWLNGKPLGRHDSGYTAFAFEVTPNLILGAENELAVRVRQVTHDFRFDTNDDWAMGGIYRDVWLEPMPATRWIDRVDVQTTFDDQFRDADLKVRTIVGDSSPRRTVEKPYDLAFTLLDQDGKPVQTSNITIPLPSRNRPRYRHHASPADSASLDSGDTLTSTRSARNSSKRAQRHTRAHEQSAFGRSPQQAASFASTARRSNCAESIGMMNIRPSDAPPHQRIGCRT